MGRRRKTLLFAILALAGLLPIAVFQVICWLQTVHDMNSRLSHYAFAVADRADQIFGAAETTLAGMSQNLTPLCTDATYQALRRAIFESIYFQEATLIVDGAVICNSNLNAGSTRTITIAENRIVPERGIHISAAVSLPQERIVSIIIHYRARGDAAHGAMFGLHLNPLLLGEATVKSVTADWITLAVERSDGALLSQFGFRGDLPLDRIKGKRLIVQSKRYPIRVVAVGSSTWLLRNWQQDAPIFGIYGLITSALLLALLLHLLRHQLLADVSAEDALAAEQLHVYYQPIMDIGTGACVGAEALLRWQHPQLGTIMPDGFVATAEKSGFIVKLTQWLMGRIATEMATLLKTNPHLYISLNLSPQHFADARLLADIKSIFGPHIAPRQIMFEVTEHQLIMNDDNQALQVLKNIRALGMRVAIDDFGSGYSSLKYLSHFPFDYLKIDKVFIDAIGSGSVTAGLVDTIVQMARQLNLEIVAEGVETEVQLSYLRQLKVNLMQGWLFSKALPAEQFHAFVAANSASKPPGIGITPCPGSG